MLMASVVLKNVMRKFDKVIAVADFNLDVKCIIPAYDCIRKYGLRLEDDKNAKR